MCIFGFTRKWFITYPITRTLTLRDRTIPKCDLPNVCNTLEINIERISIRNDGKKNDVEHYAKSPHIEYIEILKTGLAKVHYFINDTTTLTSYCLENYEQGKDIKGCNNRYRETNDKYKKSNDSFITAYPLFKILVNSVDKLIAPMNLTYELLNTQFYDKIEEHKTLGDIRNTKKKWMITTKYPLTLKPSPQE